MAEELHFGHLGNGVTVWDSCREVDYDYSTVAYISCKRSVLYREFGRSRNIVKMVVKS